MNRTYYTAIRQEGCLRGQVYRCDPTGNHPVALWTSETRYFTRGEALDAAVEWMEDNGVDAELD